MKKTKLDTRKLPPEFLRVVQAVVKRPPERKGETLAGVNIVWMLKR